MIEFSASTEYCRCYRIFSKTIGDMITAREVIDTSTDDDKRKTRINVLSLKGTGIWNGIEQSERGAKMFGH